MRTLTALIAAIVVLGGAATASAVEFTPSWGYAFIDDHPFNEPGSNALLPGHQALPRGRIQDTVTDGFAVRITVFAFDANGDNRGSYSVRSDGELTQFDRRMDVPAQIAYMGYDFCRTTSPAQCLGRHRIGRPPPQPSPPPPGSPAPPPPPEDRDLDGVPSSADCDDTNSTVWPGGREVPGNGLDDDCAGGDQPARLSATVKVSWRPKRVNVSLVRLRVVEAPPGARIEVRCLGRRCRFRSRVTNADANGSAPLGRLIRRRMRPGTTLEVRITAPSLIGKVVRYPIKRAQVPNSRRLCLPPGAAKPSKC